jgi:hypothetical protein
MVEALTNVLEETASIFRVEECQKVAQQFPPLSQTAWCHIFKV